MRRLLCRVFGHHQVPARPLGPMIIPDGPGLVLGWRIVPEEESRGIGCPRCARYVEHAWVETARIVTGREP